MQLATVAQRSYPARMELQRDEIRAWLERIIREKGTTASALAREAGLATTTLTRFLADDSAALPSLRTLAKLADVSGHPLPWGGAHEILPALGGYPAGRADFAEPEAEPYRATGSEEVLAALRGGRNAAVPWRLASRALELAGYMPGDILIVDLNARPEAGDVVCAQVYKWTEHTAETVFRVYEPPFLTVAAADPAILAAHRRPLVVDDERVVIKGVVTDVWRRPRRRQA